MAQQATYKIQFAEPISQIIESNGKKYYMQLATNNGQDIMICSDWFRSDGMKAGIDKKPEMLLKTGGRLREVLNVIEAEAVKQLHIPSELVSQFGLTATQLDGKTFYKPVHNGEYMYIKLHRDCAFFNAKREVMKKCDVGYGEYRVVIHVKGLYIGQNENGPTASLHLRIFQVQYRDVNVTCLFETSAGLLTNASQPNTQNPQNMPPETPSANPPQPTTSGKKNGRKGAKATLQRQNGTMIESQQQVPLEVLPQDFISEFNI